jgi:hypothetical protein
MRSAIAATFGGTPEPQIPRSLPLSGWIFILWTSIATIFYIANHTYVQTRYILVTAPALTIVILALALKSSRCAGRALYISALIWALAVSLVIVRPFLWNKAIVCRQMDNLAQFIRDQIPPDAPVAVYAIGQIAFVSQHPIVDTGGITRPEAIPYLNGHPAAMARWARSQGARYYIDSAAPETGATAVYTVSFPFTGWTIRTAHYTTSDPVSIWKLPDGPVAPQP